MQPSDTTPKASRRWFTSLAALGGLAVLTAGAQGQTQATPADANAPHGRYSPEHMAKALEQRINGLIKTVNGTPEQKDHLLKLAQTAMADLQPLREQHRTARKKGMELLAASAVDRNALERLRLEQMALADSMSKRMLQHLADAAEVLTPAQRSLLAERLRQRGEHGRGHHFGHGMGGLGWGGGWSR